MRSGRGKVIALGLDYMVYSVCKKIFKTQKILTFRSPFQHRKASLPIQWPSVQVGALLRMRTSTKLRRRDAALLEEEN